MLAQELCWDPTIGTYTTDQHREIILPCLALQKILHLCIPKKDLVKPHFLYQLNISKTEL
jgi:hypothetical protein